MNNFFQSRAGVHPLRTASWIKLCDTNNRGEPMPTLHNALIALRCDPHWENAFGFDEMLQTRVLRGRPIEDIDVERVHEWLQANHLKRMAFEPVREAVDIVCHDNPFHPLRDWLERLEWDTTPRIAGWLARYLGTPDDNYHATIGAMFLVAMIARILRPGCKCDYMLVLEGPQGILKSAAAATLAGKYYSDTLPDLSGDAVRVSQHLRGKWLLEVSELSAFSRAEASRLKAFLSTQIEQYTPKFGRSEVHQPRQCLFVGTTNDATYLKDETGGRRFWPAKCGTIDIDALRVDREQLFAEALDAYRRGAQWWPDRNFETNIIAPQQAARLWIDAWQEPVEIFLETRLKVTLMDVAEQALFIEKPRFSMPDQKRLACIMRNAGWEIRRDPRTRRMAWEPCETLRNRP